MMCWHSYGACANVWLLAALPVCQCLVRCTSIDGWSKVESAYDVFAQLWCLCQCLAAVRFACVPMFV